MSVEKSSIHKAIDHISEAILSRGQRYARCTKATKGTAARTTRKQR